MKNIFKNASLRKGVALGLLVGVSLIIAIKCCGKVELKGHAPFDITMSTANGFKSEVKKMAQNVADEKKEKELEIDRLEREAIRKDKEAEEERIEQEEEESKMEETYTVYEDERTLIRRYCSIYGVSSPLAVAISRLETGNWTSSGFVNYNNFGGMMGSSGLMSFPTREEGCEAFVSMLSWYSSNGMSTPETMGPTYCPEGTEHWISLVGQIMMEELVG